MSLNPPTSTSIFFPPPIHLSHYARKQATPSASPSPSKKRRLSPSSTHSTVNSPAPSDVEALTSARYQSSMRVLSVWNSLETKYARDLADDDIVDIATGRVIQDKGVLRQMPEGKWAIGCFAGVGEDDGINTDAEDGNPDDEDDEDEDEDFEGWSRVDYQYTVAPPIMAAPSPTKSISSLAASMVQDDEEDLRAFMRAEEARRAREGDIDADLDALSFLGEENDDGEEEDAEEERGSELESDLGEEIEDESSEDELNLGDPSPIRRASVAHSKSVQRGSLEPFEDEGYSSPELGGSMTSAHQRPPSPSPPPKSLIKPLSRRREASPNPQQLRTPPISNASVEPSDIVPVIPPSSVRKASPSQRMVKQQKLKFDLVPQYSDEDLSSRRRQVTVDRSLSPSPPPNRVERYVSELRFSNSPRKRKRGRESMDLSLQGTSSDVEDPSQADNDLDPLERFSDIDEQYPSSQFAADNVSEGDLLNIDEPHPHMFAYSPEPWDQAEADVFSHPGPSSRAGSSAELPQSIPPMPYPYSTQLPHAPPQVHPPDPSVLAQVMYSLNYLAFSGYNAPHPPNTISPGHPRRPHYPPPHASSSYPYYSYSMSTLPSPPSHPQLWSSQPQPQSHQALHAPPSRRSRALPSTQARQSTTVTPILRRQMSPVFPDNTTPLTRQSSSSPDSSPLSSPTKLRSIEPHRESTIKARVKTRMLPPPSPFLSRRRSTQEHQVISTASTSTFGSTEPPLRGHSLSPQKSHLAAPHRASTALSMRSKGSSISSGSMSSQNGSHDLSRDPNRNSGRGSVLSSSPSATRTPGRQRPSVLDNKNTSRTFTTPTKRHPLPLPSTAGSSTPRNHLVMEFVDIPPRTVRGLASRGAGRTE